jgi:fatty acid desaturase
MYYWNYHSRHHAHTGSVLDRDGEILFQQWHFPPSILRDSAFLRLIWTCIFSLTVYIQFCFAKAKLDSPHLPTLQHEGVSVMVFLLFAYNWGILGIVYLALSSAFSLGACGHPYIHFWMIQHWFVQDRLSVRQQQQNSTTSSTTSKSFQITTISSLQDLAKSMNICVSQPTMSFTSFSSGKLFTMIWHTIHFGELRHVEHHDFPFIPYLRAYRLPQIASEFYQDLIQSTSPFDALQQWLREADLMTWMKHEGDFAGREHFLTDLNSFISKGLLDEEDDDLTFFASGSNNQDLDDENYFVGRAVIVGGGG